MNIALSILQQNIINNYQKCFPLCDEPFKEVANQLNCTESEVIKAIEELNSHNILSRLGPVFDHKKAGASTLAAIAVPEEQLDKIAAIVNQFEQVNHNYAREHHYNLWFVVTAKDPIALNTALTDIELQTGFKVLVLPMEASYHIDLSFKINFGENNNADSGLDKLTTDNKARPTIVNRVKETPSISMTGNENKNEKLGKYPQALLRTILEKGLPLTAKPYQQLAKTLGLDTQLVINQIALWQQEGLIKRFGLVVKHRQLGYVANAMVVWNIKDEEVDAVAGRLSKRDEISLCYRRPRRLPDWPYNLFCMIHGKNRTEVEQQIKNITAELALDDIEKDVLFSYKAYKQNGARYQTADQSTENKQKKENR